MIPRFIHSGMAGAPAMSTAVSGGLSVLNAALVDGFNVTAPQSVTASGGVVTFNYLVAHGYESGCWVRVSGAGAAALNADRQCSVPNALTFTVVVPGIPDGAVSGSISVRVAPLGWDRPFTDTNVAVYRSPDLAGTRTFLRVIDNNAASQFVTRLRAYESMSSASVGVDPFPTIAQAADTVLPGFSKSAGGAWCVVGDDRTFYLMATTSGGTQAITAFGDFTSFKPADAYGCMVMGQGAGATNFLAQAIGNASMHLARDATALIKSLTAGHLGMSPGSSGVSSRPYPGPVTGGITIVAPMIVIDGTNAAASPVRGVLRGSMFVMEAMPVTGWVVISSVPGITGRVVVLADRQNAGLVAFPLDQEW